MSSDKQKARAELTRRGPFWVCFIVFLLLACDYGFRFANLVDQRERLTEAMLNQARNSGALEQAQELEKRIEAFSLDLLQVARTNATARQVVQEFNIQFSPGSTTNSPPLAEATRSK